MNIDDPRYKVDSERMQRLTNFIIEATKEGISKLAEELRNKTEEELKKEKFEDMLKKLASNLLQANIKLVREKLTRDEIEFTTAKHITDHVMIAIQADFLSKHPECLLDILKSHL